MPILSDKADKNRITLGLFAVNWLEGRRLKPRTRSDYQVLLDRFILPTFATVPVVSITRDEVRAWYARLPADRPTQRARTYSLLRTIMGSAVSEEIIQINPVHIRGAGNVVRAKEPRPASLTELEIMVSHVPQRYRLMLLLAAWCALRFGELAELRVKDMDLDLMVIRVRRGVVRATGEVLVDSPKSRAGSRDVAIPPHLRDQVAAHLASLPSDNSEALLFPARHGGNLAPSTLYRVYYPAREAAGRPDLRFHDLRHTGAVLAAQTGATLADLMARLGHSTPGAAMLYQHAALDRDRQIAAALSALASTPIQP